jgi:rRNA maturation endonuclease Nob1
MGVMTKCYINKSLVSPALLAQVWTHCKIEKLNMWTLFCKACIDFLNNQIWKEIMLELNNGKQSSVTTFSTDFSFQNLVFGIYLNFQQQKSLKKSISSTIWIQILPNKVH